MPPARPCSTQIPVLLLLLAGAWLSACGAGTAAIAAGSNGNSGSGTTPQLSAFEVPKPKESPAGLRRRPIERRASFLRP